MGSDGTRNHRKKSRSFLERRRDVVFRRGEILSLNGLEIKFSDRLKFRLESKEKILLERHQGKVSDGLFGMTMATSLGFLASEV